MADLRNDLINMQVRRNPFLVPLLVNPIKVSTISGSIAPIPYGTATIQTNRTLGAAVTAEALANNMQTYALQEQLDRQLIDDRIVAQYGGLDGAQRVAASRGMMAVYKKLEALLAAQVFDGGATVPSTSTNYLSDLRSAAEALRDISNGQLALVVSFSQWQVLVNDAGIKDAISHAPTVTIGQLPAEAIRDARQNLLAAAIGVDMVLRGGNDVWYTGITAQTCAAVIQLPNGTMTAEEEAQPISYVQQVVENESGLLSVTTHQSDDLKANVVDTRAFADFDVENADLIQLVKLS